MRRRGDLVTITTGKYAGRTGTVEANVYQRTVYYPGEWANGYHIMLDAEELVTVRWDQVLGLSRTKPEKDEVVRLWAGSQPNGCPLSRS